MRLFAHRGYHKQSTVQENSLQAIKEAAKAGFHGVEIDVRFTLDKVPVLSHDNSMRRVYGITGYVSNTRLQDLPKTVATWTEALAYIRRFRLQVIVDMKSATLEYELFRTIEGTLPRGTMVLFWHSKRPPRHRPDLLCLKALTYSKVPASRMKELHNRGFDGVSIPGDKHWYVQGKKGHVNVYVSKALPKAVLKKADSVTI